MAMEKKYLIINLGSTSKRYAFYFKNKEVLNAHFDLTNLKFKVKIKENTEEEKLLTKDYKNSVKGVVRLLIRNNIISNAREISALGIRIVAPGKYFQENKVIDKDYLKKLSYASKITPLHLNPIIEELKQIKKELPRIQIVGVSDSAFHSTIPEFSKIYGLPKKITSDLEIYRYGYHGISISSVLNKIRQNLTYIPSKIIVCHLGGGSSITAIRNSESMENSMGFTPLEGLTGSTRIGNIDPGASIYLAKKLKLNPEKLENFFNFKCGFLGLVNHTDMRDVLNLENKSKTAKLAIEFYTSQIKKYIGSYFALLNGLDLLVFTGAVGEGSARIRELACENLSALGIHLDQEKNKNPELFIHSEDSKVKVAIVKTNEMEEMLIETIKII